MITVTLSPQLLSLTSCCINCDYSIHRAFMTGYQLREYWYSCWLKLYSFSRRPAIIIDLLWEFCSLMTKLYSLWGRIPRCTLAMYQSSVIRSSQCMKHRLFFCKIIPTIRIRINFQSWLRSCWYLFLSLNVECINEDE